MGIERISPPMEPTPEAAAITEDADRACLDKRNPGPIVYGIYGSDPCTRILNPGAGRDRAN